MCLQLASITVPGLSSVGRCAASLPARAAAQQCQWRWGYMSQAGWSSAP